MASNGSTIADEDGDFGDWVELHNRSVRSASIEGWGLSDDPAQPFRWVFPPIVMEPGQFLLVWASGKNRSDPAGELHTSFSIAADGEPLSLTRADGTVADEMPATALPRDFSLGRKPGTELAWYFFDEPTPGAANTTSAYDEILARPEFSQPGGFYPQPFSLTLNAPPGVTVYYTLDGSEPDPENLGGRTYSYANSYPFGSHLNRVVESRVYSGPIPIADRAQEANRISTINTMFSGGTTLPAGVIYKGTPVRARAFREGALSSAAETHTYFIHSGAAPRYDLMTISITTDEPSLFDFVSGISVPGKIADDWWAAHGYQNGGTPANYHGRGPEWERSGHIEFFDPEGGRVLSHGTGLRMHGGWSRGLSPRKSFRLYAREQGDEEGVFSYPLFPDLKATGTPGAPVADFRRLVLRNSGNDFNGTLFRDALMQELVRHLPLDTQAYRPAIHFINGEYWGIINIRERFDRHYVASHYNMDPDDVAIVVHNPDAGVVLDTGDASDLQHYLDLVQYARGHNLADETAFAHVATLMDVENFATYYAIQIYVGNDDWPQNNMDFWRKRTAAYEPEAPYGHDGRWRWMLYDTDFGFDDGVAWRNSLARVAQNRNVGGFPPSAWAAELFQNLLANERFRNGFVNTIGDLANSVFHPDRVHPLVDQFNARIESSRSEHQHRWHNGTNRAGFMKNFATQRPVYIRNHTVEVFSLAGTANLTVINPRMAGGRVKVNSLLLDAETPGSRVEPTMETNIFASGSTWRFLDDGSDQGEAWRTSAFPDGGWKEGEAAFGYGPPGGHTTEVDFGSDPAGKPITTYFRKPFLWEGADPDGLNLSLSVAGGAVYYLNGAEILRHRMPDGPIDFTTLAYRTGEVATPRVWLAADGDMNTRKAAGDFRVTEWTDLSGNGSHAVQDNNSLQPVLLPDALHGKPAVRFDGGDRFLQAPIGDYRDGMTLYLVARVHGDGGPYDSYLGMNGAGLGNVLYHVGSTGGRGLGITQPNQNLSANPAPSSEFELIRIDAGPDYTQTMTRLSSGASVTVKLTQTGGIVTNMTLGASKHSGEGVTDFLPVDIAELAIYDRQLDGLEAAAVEAYLSDKYALTLPVPWIAAHLAAEAIVPGENVLAAEVHLPSADAESLHFDARLAGTMDAETLVWTGTYFRGVPVTVEAIPEAGYRFAGWEGRPETGSVLALTLSEAATLTPIFELDDAGLEDLIPPPHHLSGGPYSFTEWDELSLAGTYPPHMIFEQTFLSDPGLAVEMDSFWELPYNLTSRSRINGRGIDGISFVNTGNAQELPGSGFLGSAILALDTRGLEHIQVTWSGGTVAPNSRVYGLRLQYRIGDQGAFIDVLDDVGNPVEYIRNELAGHGEIIGPVLLPSEVEGRPYVQLRWRYYYISGGAGARAQLRLDDILVTAGPPDDDEGDAVFLPGGTADWTYDLNWTTSRYPDGAGVIARIGKADGGDRDVNLRAPVTLGDLVIDNGDSPYRNRIRDLDLGNTLTFAAGPGPATLSVTAAGTGFTELAVEAGTRLEGDLLVTMNDLAGDPPYGGLRLRETWSGPGGLRKAGAGMLSFTGGGKDYEGPTIVDLGVLSVTAPAAPSQTSGIAVNPGGQLRLVSANDELGARIYTFGGSVVLNSEGRGGGIPEGENEGIRGALRYEPGGIGNRAVVVNDIILAGDSGIHVSGIVNTLEVEGALSGAGAIIKSGGGRLLLRGDSSGYEADVTVEAGILRVDGPLGSDVFLDSGTVVEGTGSVGNVAGSGTVAPGGEILTAGSVNGLHYQFLFGQTGSPDYDNVSASGNGLLRLTGETPFVQSFRAMNRIDLYLDLPGLADGDILRGGFFAANGGEFTGHLEGAAFRIFLPHPDGENLLEGQAYRLDASGLSVSVSTVEEQAVFGDGVVTGHVMQIVLEGDPPDSYAAWVGRMFSDPSDRADPAISGAGADPRGEGVSNILRYALEIDPNAPGRALLPRPEAEGERLFLQFHRDPSKTDIAYIVEASSNLTGWGEVLYDSRAAGLENTHGDAMRISDSMTLDEVEGGRFLRLRIELIE